MPGKNKPKRLDRNRKWRVARRKKKRAEMASGNSRNRKPRPKKKGVVSSVVEARNSVPSKLGTKIPSSSGKVKKVVEKEE